MIGKLNCPCALQCCEDCDVLVPEGMIVIRIPRDYAERWLRGDADHDVLQAAIEEDLCGLESVDRKCERKRKGMVNDKTVEVLYLGFGLDAPREPGDGEEIVCLPKDGQSRDEAAKELLQDVFSVHLQEGLPGPVRFGELVPLFKAALEDVELEPPDGSDRCHWFVLRWTERPS